MAKKPATPAKKPTRKPATPAKRAAPAKRPPAPKAPAPKKKSTPKPPKPTKPKAKAPAVAPADKPLTEIEKVFCQEFMVDMVAYKAYMRARPGCAGPSARVQSSRLLATPNIQAEIARLKAERAERTGVTADRVMLEVARLGLFDVRKLFSADGSPKSIQDLDDDTAAAIAGLDVATVGNREVGFGQVLKYKLADKGANLERLMKHHGLFKQDNDQAGAAAANALGALLKEMGRSALQVVAKPDDEE